MIIGGQNDGETFHETNIIYFFLVFFEMPGINLFHKFRMAVISFVKALIQLQSGRAYFEL